MKINATIFRSIFVFALLGFFALPAVGHEVGLYQDEGLTVNQVESSGAEYMTLYLGLHWDPSVDPVANGILVKGFTGRIRCEGPVVLVSAQFDSFIGNAEALPDLLIYGGSVDLEDGYSGILCRFLFEVTGSDPARIYLEPMTGDDSMTFYTWLNGEENLLWEMAPVSGSFSAPVFAINGMVVATEPATMSGIRALYRN
jgi:hypothetical protein